MNTKQRFLATLNELHQAAVKAQSQAHYDIGDTDLAERLGDVDRIVMAIYEAYWDRATTPSTKHHLPE